jgi:uncharacterized damage-inducible protein DinB
VGRVRAKDLERLYDYGYWANGKLFVVIAALTPEEFTRSVAGSYGSVRNTLVHMLSVEWGWLERCGGTPRGARLEPADFPTFQSILETWGRVELDMRRFLAGLDERDLERRVEFQFPGSLGGALPVRSLLQHGANHGVHYRGQIALLLRLLGRAPGDVDLLYYDAERISPTT